MTLSSEQCLHYYSGDILYVIVTDDKGEKIRLRFKHFLPYIGVGGIRSRFRLTLDDQYGFKTLEKLG